MQFPGATRQDVSDEAMARMDDVKMIPDLRRVGSAYALKHVSLAHLEGFV